METPLLEHTRSVRREGIVSLTKVMIFSVVVAAVTVGAPGAWPLAAICGAGALLLYFGYVRDHLRAEGFFVLRIYPTRIVCESPVCSVMRSFDLPLADVDHLEYDTRSGFDWTIVMRDGERYRITEHYQVPVHRFVRILENTQPPVPVIKLQTWESPWARRKREREQTGQTAVKPGKSR